MGHNNRVSRRAFFTSIFILSLSGCSKSEKPAPAPSTAPWPKVRIGYLPVAAELPLFVAVENQMFEKRGVSVELFRVASSNEMGTSGTADRIDILAGAAANVVFDVGNVSGKRHLLFATNPYSDKQGHITDKLIVRNGLQIENVSGLKGKRIANIPGSVKVLLQLGLEKLGLPRDQYEYLELLPKDWQPALASGAIDAVLALEPAAAQIIKDGTGHALVEGFLAKLLPDVPISGHWIAADFYKRADQKQIEAILAAYNEAITFCREKPAEAKRLLVKYASVREDIVESVNLNPWKTLSDFTADELQKYADLLAENGAVQAKPRANEYILPKPK